MMTNLSKQRVSVIIPVYNGEKFVSLAISSALKQTYQTLEIIVVDDGSTDRSREIIQSFGNHVQYVYQQNTGLSGARNAGIKAAKGDYIALLDADDTWLPEKIQIQTDYMTTNPEVGMVGCYLEPVDVIGDKLGGTKPQIRPAENFEDMYILGGPAPSSVMFRRRCLDYIGLFNEQLPGMEDLDFYLRMAEIYRVSFIDKILGNYRVWGGSLSQTKVFQMNLALMSIGLWMLGKKKSYSKKKQIRQRTAKYAYLVGKEYFLNGEFKNATKNIAQAISICPTIGSAFFSGENMWLLKLRKLLTPYGLLGLCVLKIFPSFQSKA